MRSLFWIALALSAPAGASAQTQEPPAMPLPDGRMTLFAGQAESASFLVESDLRRDGSRIELSVYRVYDPGITLSPGRVVAQSVQRQRIDCAARTVETSPATAYDEQGRYLINGIAEPRAPIERNSTSDFAAKVVCDGAQLPPQNTVPDRAAALVGGRAAIKAQIHPDVPTPNH